MRPTHEGVFLGHHQQEKARAATPRPAEPAPAVAGRCNKTVHRRRLRVIGIDRILREADVAKASLYSLLGSKDNLVIAYLEQLDEQFRARWGERAAKAPDADAKILAFFDMAIDEEPEKDFRGSPFLNAAGEYPRPEVESEERIIAACVAHRSWMHETITALLTEKNGYESSALADELLIFLDGGLAGARILHSVEPLRTARALAENTLGAPPPDYSI